MKDGPTTPRHEAVFRGMVLNPGTRTAIARMNISDPTPIQEQSIPPLLEGRDLIGQARTGSGKTLAFAVPLVEQCDATSRQVQALVLVPTRELAIQVGGVVEDLAGSQGLHVTLLYGGRSVAKDHRALRQGAQIIIGTPGRTLDHVRQGSLNLRSVQFLVLDEADEMLDRGFARDVDAILSQTPTQRQTALFSATVPDWVAKTARKHLHDPVTVAVDADLEALPTVEHLVYSIQKTDKMEALRTLLDRRDGSPVLVFGKTKHGVQRLARQLDEAGYPVGALQGNLSQVARERVMQNFRSGVAPILVATTWRAGPGRRGHRTGHQLRPPRLGAAVHPPRGPHRPHGSRRRGHHVHHAGRRPQVARDRARPGPPVHPQIMDGGSNGPQRAAGGRRRTWEPGSGAVRVRPAR